VVKNFYKWIKSDSTRELVFLLILVLLIRTFGFGLYQVPTGSMETTMLVGERFFADKFTPLFLRPKRGDVISFNDPLYVYSKNPIMRVIQEYFRGPSNWTKRVIGIPGDKIRGVIEQGKPVVYLNGVKIDEPYINKYPLLDIFTVDTKEIIALFQEAFSEGGSNHVDLGKYYLRISYEPDVPFEKQKFYSFKEGQIITDNGQLSLIPPGIPLPGSANTDVIKKGNSYWNGTDEYYVELDDNHYWLMGDNRLGSNDSRFWGPLDGKYIRGKILFRIWSVDSREGLWIWDLIKHPIGFWSRVRWSRFFQWIR
jgi:signal peptidase I